MFDIKTSKKRFDANKVKLTEGSGYPYVVRTSQNNGIKGFLDEPAEFLNPGNTLSFGQDTATIYYQESPYFTGDKIKILHPKNESFSKSNAQFFVAAMNQSFNSFEWGVGSYGVDVIESQPVKLPVSNGEIDFGFIESFLAELEAAHLAELEAYLEAAGLDDYVLTKEERVALESFEKITWGEHKIPDVFSVKNTKNILSKDIIENSGPIPYLGAGSKDNSVISYIDYDEKMLEFGSCVFIGGKTFVVTYQKGNFFSNDSHNLALYYKYGPLTENVQLFLVSLVNKGLSHIYSWGDSISRTKIQNDIALFPTVGNELNVESKQVETLIRAVKKLVIKDVVDFSRRKSAATRQAIES